MTDFDLALFDCELHLALLELELQGTAYPAPSPSLEELPVISALELYL